MEARRDFSTVIASRGTGEDITIVYGVRTIIMESIR